MALHDLLARKAKRSARELTQFMSRGVSDVQSRRTSSKALVGMLAESWPTPGSEEGDAIEGKVPWSCQEEPSWLRR